MTLEKGAIQCKIAIAREGRLRAQPMHVYSEVSRYSQWGLLPGKCELDCSLRLLPLEENWNV